MANLSAHLCYLNDAESAANFRTSAFNQSPSLAAVEGDCVELEMDYLPRSPSDLFQSMGGYFSLYKRASSRNPPIRSLNSNSCNRYRLPGTYSSNSIAFFVSVPYSKLSRRPTLAEFLLDGRLKRPKMEATPPSPLLAFPAENIFPQLPVKSEDAHHNRPRLLCLPEEKAKR